MRVEFFADDLACFLDRFLPPAIARGQAGEVVHHRIAAEVELGQDHARRLLRRIGQLQHIAAVGGERQFGQRAGEAGVRIDDGEQGARGHVQARERAPHEAQRLAHEPMRAVSGQDGVDGEHAVDFAARLQLPGADVELVGAQHEYRVVQFARHLQRPPGDAGFDDAFDRIGLRLARA